MKTLKITNLRKQYISALSLERLRSNRNPFADTSCLRLVIIVIAGLACYLKAIYTLIIVWRIPRDSFSSFKG